MCIYIYIYIYIHILTLLRARGASRASSGGRVFDPSTISTLRNCIHVNIMSTLMVDVNNPIIIKY